MRVTCARSASGLRSLLTVLLYSGPTRQETSSAVCNLNLYNPQISMPLQTINISASANDGTGDPLRTAFGKVNDNFAVLDTVFNVLDEDFAGGADPTGATDCTAAIQAAIDAIDAAGGGILYFPKGSHDLVSRHARPLERPASLPLILHFLRRCIRNVAGSLNHLVRLEEEYQGDGEAERLGGLEVDDELELWAAPRAGSPDQEHALSSVHWRSRNTSNWLLNVAGKSAPSGAIVSSCVRTSKRPSIVPLAGSILSTLKSMSQDTPSDAC